MTASDTATAQHRPCLSPELWRSIFRYAYSLATASRWDPQNLNADFNLIESDQLDDRNSTLVSILQVCKVCGLLRESF